MRILMTTDTVGGVWTYAVDLCGELARRGVAVTLVTMGRRMTEAQRRAADAIRGLSVVETELRLEWMADPWHDVARANDLLWELALQWSPDAVHLNGYAHALLPWRDAGFRTVLVGHSCVGTWWRAVKGEAPPAEWDVYTRAVRAGLHAADAFVAPTRAMLDAYARCYGPHHDPHAIHNGRDASGYAPAAKDPFVLAAGRVWDEAKNVALLERAAREIDAPVCIAGELGPFRRLSPSVEALGSLPPRELARWMARAAVYVLPARYEPFGLSALEAAHCGCALVLGDIPTLREVWGDAAAYVDPDDPRHLADTVNRLMRLRDERADLAAAARRRAQRYSLDAMADAYLALYRDAPTPAHARPPMHLATT